MWQKGSPAEIPMVTISCDVCGKQRTTGAGDWILGFDVPASSAPMGRSIKFLERWEERRVLDPGAIHFCCDECGKTYVQNAQAA
jgi:hypothetical protein